MKRNQLEPGAKKELDHINHTLWTQTFAESTPSQILRVLERQLWALAVEPGRMRSE